MNDYEIILSELSKKRNCKLVEFSSKIIRTKFVLIGSYSTDIKNIFKKYKTIDLNSFNEFKYYEMNLIYITYGLKQNKTIGEQIKFLLENKDIIDCWAIVDSTAKLIETKPIKEELKMLDILASTDEEFLIRYKYIKLFDYVTKDNLEIIFNNIMNSEFYYVLMGEAWLLAECFIKYPDDTFLFIKNSEIDNKIKLKTISKICDSYRVNNENKLKVKEFRNTLKK